VASRENREVFVSLEPSRRELEELGRRHVERYRKLSVIMTGRKRTPEQRANIGAGVRRAWEAKRLAAEAAIHAQEAS